MHHIIYGHVQTVAGTHIKATYPDTAPSYTVEIPPPPDCPELSWPLGLKIRIIVRKKIRCLPRKVGVLRLW